MMIESNENIVVCCNPKCSEVIEVIPNRVDYTAKDENNKQVSRETAEHMAKYRIRCAKCTENFCASCKMVPYHLGKNCEEAAKFK